jgi:hypothetical protein
VSRLGRATTEGAYSFVRDRAKDLTKSLKGTDYEKKIAEHLKALDDKALEAEIKAEKDLGKIERRLYTKGAAPAIKKALEKFAEKNATTKAAKRAEELAAAIG